jgi:DNA ligase-1
VPIERRTCKHLRAYRGERAEKDRVGGELPAKSESSSSGAVAPGLLLAHTWQNDVDLTDWWVSEKLDGVRAYWDGSQFISRLGNVYHAPDFFVAGLPKTPLDGELWLGRKAFQRCVSIVRRQDKSEHWRSIRFLVFDLPSAPGRLKSGWSNCTIAWHRIDRNSPSCISTTAAVGRTISAKSWPKSRRWAAKG